MAKVLRPRAFSTEIGKPTGDGWTLIFSERLRFSDALALAYQLRDCKYRDHGGQGSSLFAGTIPRVDRFSAAMRRVKVVDRPGETYPYAAVDLETGEILLRLTDPSALLALCHRLDWAVHQGSDAGAESSRQHSGERRRTHRPKHRVGGGTKYTSARRGQKYRNLAQDQA